MAAFANEKSVRSHTNENLVNAKILTTRTNTAKKNAFGELKNIMHIAGTTPFRTNADNGFSKINSIFSNKPPKAQARCNTGVDAVALKNFDDSADTENWFEHWDYNRPCCADKNAKSDEDVWAEMNKFDDSLFDKMGDDDYSENDDQLNMFDMEKELDKSEISLLSPFVFISGLEHSYGKEDDKIIVKAPVLPSFEDDYSIYMCS